MAHRLAGGGSVKGIGSFRLEWVFAQCGRLPATVRGDNAAMQNLPQKHGFVRRGTAYAAEDDYPRPAYERSGEKRRSIEPSNGYDAKKDTQKRVFF